MTAPLRPSPRRPHSVSLSEAEMITLRELVSLGVAPSLSAAIRYCIDQVGRRLVKQQEVQNDGSRIA